jgi:hypothetical protein
MAELEQARVSAQELVKELALAELEAVQAQVLQAACQVERVAELAVVQPSKAQAEQEAVEEEPSSAELAEAVATEASAVALVELSAPLLVVAEAPVSSQQAPPWVPLSSP